MVKLSSSERYRFCCCSDLICGETFFSKTGGCETASFLFLFRVKK